MKTVTLLFVLLMPIAAFADKYEDVNQGLREILIAMSQISVQGKDASTFGQIQQGLMKIGKDVTDMQKEFKAVEEAAKCEKKEEVKE